MADEIRYPCARCFRMIVAPLPAQPTSPSPKPPFVCPVCCGRHTVPIGFYNIFGSENTTNTGTTPCRTCKGAGIVWG